MQPAAQPERRPGLEDRPRLVGVEGALLAERVHPARVRRRRLEHRAGDQVDVAGRVVGVLGRHDVRAEERGLVGELAGHGQAAGLVADGQPVAGLDLDGRGALAAHLLDQPGDVRGELLVGRGPGGGHGGADPAGGVRLAGHPGRELLRPVAGEDQVAVAVDEPREHRAAAGVDDLVGVRHVGGPADPGDPAALDDQRRRRG